jgi:mercuric ion transport protein
MRKNRLLLTGIIGTITILFCCLTPVLVVLLGVAGLGAVTGYLDYVLFPLLFIFLGLTLFAYRKHKRSVDEKDCHTTGDCCDSKNINRDCRKGGTL